MLLPLVQWQVPYFGYQSIARIAIALVDNGLMRRDEERNKEVKEVNSEQRTLTATKCRLRPKG